MASGTGTHRLLEGPSAAASVRDRIDRTKGDEFWGVSDFPKLSSHAVARALARLADEGFLIRVRPGVYYKSRQAAFGTTIPSSSALTRRITQATVHPAGLSAATALGLSPQVPARPEIATTGNNPPGAYRNAKVRVRRPDVRRKLSPQEGAFLELLRDRVKYSDLSDDETVERLVSFVRQDRTFERLARAALDEPPRVRAMLGAIGETADIRSAAMKKLRESLNPMSKFDFGRLRVLASASNWQAR